LFNLEDAPNFASGDNIILRATDGKEFILTEMDSFDQEVELTRKNQELINILDQRSKDKGVLTIQLS